MKEMNMKKLLLYILPMLLFFSCAKDDLTGSSAVQDAEGVKNTFSLSVDNSALVQTRSSADNQVDTAKIENVWVVQFIYSPDGTGALMGTPQYLDKATDFNPSNMEVKLKAGTCNIYFVANTFDASAFNSSNCSTESFFKALSKSFTTDTLMQGQLVNTNQRVPMIGKLPQYTVTATAAPTGDSNKKVMMTRTAALIDFNYQVSFPAGQHIDIKNIRVCNVPNKMYYVQNTSLTCSNAGDYYDYPLEGISESVTSNTSQSGHVMFYLPDNLCGNGDANTDTRKKNGILGKLCTYIEITGTTTDNKFVAYKVYLGKNNLTNYDVERNNFYKVSVNLQGISAFDYNMSSGVIMDKSNCYMVMPGQTILIPAKDQVNYYYTQYPASGSQILKGTRWTTNMLWTESANGMKANGCIESLKADISNGYIWVKAGTEPGNSLICVKDLSGKVLWSWHIWVTDYQPSVSMGGTTYNYNGKIWMDRNLGATSALVGGKNIGVMYEFGRKDPFPGGNGTSDTAIRQIYNASGTELTDGGTGITYVGGRVGVSTSVANPTVYYYNPNDYNRWTVDNGWDTLWGNRYNTAASATKKIFDPCPSGWRIPVFNNSVSPWNGLTKENGVRSFSSGIGAWNWQLLGVGFFPAGGYRNAGNNGALSKVGTEVGCWSGSSSYLDTENSTPGEWPWSDPVITHTYSMGGVMLSGLDDGTVNTGRLYVGTASGFAVRCIKE